MPDLPCSDIGQLLAAGFAVPFIGRDLDVGDSALLSLVSSVTFAGMVLGALFWGHVSDAYGRRPAFLLTCDASSERLSASS